MSTLPGTRTPRLWRTRDPRKLVSLGQLCLPGLELETTKTVDQAWSELESASQGIGARGVPRYTWPGPRRVDRDGINWRSEHEAS